MFGLTHLENKVHFFFQLFVVGDRFVDVGLAHFLPKIPALLLNVGQRIFETEKVISDQDLVKLSLLNEI
jgi:hypothetical protein